MNTSMKKKSQYNNAGQSQQNPLKQGARITHSRSET